MFEINIQIIFKYFEIGKIKKKTSAKQILLEFINVCVFDRKLIHMFLIHLQLADKNVVLQEFDIYYFQNHASIISSLIHRMLKGNLSQSVLIF